MRKILFSVPVMLSLMVSTAHAQSPKALLFVADRYEDLNSIRMQFKYTRLLQLERERRGQMVDIERIDFPNDEPLVHSFKPNLFAKIRETVKGRQGEPLQINILTTGHGSTGGLHSEKCRPVSYQAFAEGLIGLMRALKEDGFVSERLNFRVFVTACWSGRLIPRLEVGLPFELLTMTSASAQQMSHGMINEYVINQAHTLLEAAEAYDIRLCPSCNDSQELYLLLRYIARYSLDTGTSESGAGQFDVPELSLNPPLKDERLLASELIVNLIRTYNENLKHPVLRTPAFLTAIEFIFGDELAVDFRQIASGIDNQLEASDKLALDLLKLKGNMEDEPTPATRERLNQLGTSKERYVRRAVGEILRTYYDLFEDGDALVLKQLKNELAQSKPDREELARMEKFVKEQGYQSPDADQFCETLLTYRSGGAAPPSAN